MTEKQVIEKAINALKELGYYSDEAEIKVYNTDDEQLIEMNEELKDEYLVIFSSRLPDGRGYHTSISVDKQTHKLIRLVGKHVFMDIPEKLR
jgi:hypothetical protein